MKRRYRIFSIFLFAKKKKREINSLKSSKRKEKCSIFIELVHKRVHYNKTCSYKKLKLIDSLFSFLDEADRKEAQRSVPFVGQIEEGINQNKKSIKKEIKNVDKRIQELKMIKEANYKQHQNYTAAIADVQKNIESVIAEKEEISKNIETFQKDLENLKTEKEIDPEEQLKTMITNAIKDVKQKMNEELNKKLHKMMDDNSRQAAEEFAPHIQKLKTKHKSDVAVLVSQQRQEIEKIKQQSLLFTKDYLKDFEKNFRNQTTIMLNSTIEENKKTLERYRQKNEKDILLFQSDLVSYKRSVENQINEIKRRKQREIQLEVSTYERRIKDVRQDVEMAKVRRDKRIQYLNNYRQENREIQTMLPAFELEKKLNEKNKIIIDRRKQELDAEVQELKENLQLDINAAIQNKLDENEHKKQKLKDDVEYLNSEVTRIKQLLERYESQRERAEKRKEVTMDELHHSQSEVSRLKDRLFELTTNATTLKTKTKASSNNSSKFMYMNSDLKERNEEIIRDLKTQIQDIELEEKREEQEFNARMKIIAERHEQALKQATEKVKAVITSKDKQIEQLKEQLTKANQMLINATNAMKI